MDLKLRLGMVAAVGILFISWIFGVIAISSTSWYRASVGGGSINYGLLNSKVCANGCISASNDGQLEAAGGLCFFFFLIYVLFVPAMGLLFLAEMLPNINNKIPEKFRAYFWALPLTATAGALAGVFFWIVVFPYSDVPDGLSLGPGYGVFFGFFSAFAPVGASAAYKVLNQDLPMGSGQSGSTQASAQPS